jgi:tetrahydromethanopterin S-methyltransferase subunit C
MSEDYKKFRKACFFRFKLPIKKYNMAEIKHSLENATRDFLVLEQGYIQDNTLLDRHLVMGYIACISAITSAAYGYSHPFNYDTKVILLIGSAM